MRPIRLELSAFGPYLEHTVIDFEKLNEAGLFLITGQTGGGKTTLLDAMSIALFYKSTGGRRTFQDMRCLAAADSDRTEVVYHFALGEDEYCFRRALYRRKKRGSDNFITEEENECKRRTADGWALAASRKTCFPSPPSNFRRSSCCRRANSCSFCARIPPKKQPF